MPNQIATLEEAEQFLFKQDKKREELALELQMLKVDKSMEKHYQILVK